MTKPSISLIIPAYNEERYLPDCLASIAAQTRMPDEVIVVDNNSTDRTAAIARRFPFVRIVTERQQGIVHARNRGFNEASKAIIARIDADTQLPADWVARVHAFYSQPKHDHVALTGCARFDNVHLAWLGAWMQRQLAFRMNYLLLGHYILYGSNMAFPARLWDAVCDDVCLRNDVHEDIDLSIHLHDLGFSIAYDSRLRVAVKLRRVHSDRSALWGNLLLWPQTLRAHANRQWVVAWCGAALLYAGLPLVVLNERLAELLGGDSYL